MKTALAMFMVALAAMEVSQAHAACEQVKVSNPVANAFDARGPFLGNSMGQVFTAVELTIDTITVYRPSVSTSSIGAKLYIMAVDSVTGAPRPDQILLDGPMVKVIGPDEPGEDIRVPFVLDPPFRLPRPGQYCAMIQPEDCWQGEPWRLWISPSEAYSGGDLWESIRSTDGCVILFPFNTPYDLIFDISFCRDVTTPTMKRTWGALKMRYR